MNDGFANAYEYDMRGLDVLNLNTPEFTVLNWMAVLVEAGSRSTRMLTM